MKPIPDSVNAKRVEAQILESVDLFSLLRDIQKSFPSSVDFLELGKEYVRFLVMKTMFPNAEIFPSEMIQSIWKSHILETKSYTAFQNRVGVTVHFDPDDKLYDESDETAETYRRLFGSDLNPDFWKKEVKDVKEESSQEEEMTIFAVTQTGKTVAILCRPSDTVWEFKGKYAQSEGVPEDQQRLIFAGKQLDDGRLLSDYELTDGCTVHMVLRLRGC